MINLRRILPTVYRAEATVSRTLSSIPPLYPFTQSTVPQRVIVRPISISNSWKKKVEVDEDIEDDENDDGLPKDYKKKTLKVGSRRLDTFVSRSGGVPSSQAEKLVLGGKVCVNEEKSTKKAYNVQKGDLIDIWKEVCPDNADLAYVQRAEIRNYDVAASGYDIHVHIWRKLLVSNWR